MSIGEELYLSGGVKILAGSFQVASFPHFENIYFDNFKENDQVGSKLGVDRKTPEMS